MGKILSGILFTIFKCISFIPLRIQYVISDILVLPLVYNIFSYRLNVVRNNLKKSFPNMTGKELKRIEKRFYRHFCDCFLESIRILSMSKKESMERMKTIHPEVITDFYKKGKNVILILGHYGNWEFQNFIVHKLIEHNQNAYSVYMPLNNKSFDSLYYKLRSRFKVNMISNKNIYRTMIRVRNNRESAVFGLISDQSPSSFDLNYWTDFLNQDTAIITGPERLARQFDMAVVYADMTKLSRGYYQTEYILITDNPDSTAPNEITEKYARLMEKTIQRDPSYWLWTHRRWKRKHINADITE
jgi:Kdo2-lipid IVA lauroyltransferase/acyltransferase